MTELDYLLIATTGTILFTLSIGMGIKVYEYFTVDPLANLTPAQLEALLTPPLSASNESNITEILDDLGLTPATSNASDGKGSKFSSQLVRINDKYNSIGINANFKRNSVCIFTRRYYFLSRIWNLGSLWLEYVLEKHMIGSIPLWEGNHIDSSFRKKKN